MADTCSTCKFWEHWRVVLLADDEPQSVGHCVVETLVTLKGQLTLMINVQGLTAHDFHCKSYIPDTAENTGGNND
jgi:hypothetical protein